MIRWVPGREYAGLLGSLPSRVVFDMRVGFEVWRLIVATRAGATIGLIGQDDRAQAAVFSELKFRIQ